MEERELAVAAGRDAVARHGSIMAEGRWNITRCDRSLN
jgi:hypothetical protein